MDTLASIDGDDSARKRCAFKSDGILIDRAAVVPRYVWEEALQKESVASVSDLPQVLTYTDTKHGNGALIAVAGSITLCVRDVVFTASAPLVRDLLRGIDLRNI